MASHRSPLLRVLLVCVAVCSMEVLGQGWDYAPPHADPGGPYDISGDYAQAVGDPSLEGGEHSMRVAEMAKEEGHALDKALDYAHNALVRTERVPEDHAAPDDEDALVAIENAKPMSAAKLNAIARAKRLKKRLLKRRLRREHRRQSRVQRLKRKRQALKQAAERAKKREEKSNKQSLKKMRKTLRQLRQMENAKDKDQKRALMRRIIGLKHGKTLQAQRKLEAKKRLKQARRAVSRAAKGLLAKGRHRKARKRLVLKHKNKVLRKLDQGAVIVLERGKVAFNRMSTARLPGETKAEWRRRRKRIAKKKKRLKKRAQRIEARRRKRLRALRKVLRATRKDVRAYRLLMRKARQKMKQALKKKDIKASKAAKHSINSIRRRIVYLKGKVKRRQNSIAKLEEQPQNDRTRAALARAKLALSTGPLAAAVKARQELLSAQLAKKNAKQNMRAIEQNAPTDRAEALAHGGHVRNQLGDIGPDSRNGAIQGISGNLLSNAGPRAVYNVMEPYNATDPHRNDIVITMTTITSSPDDGKKEDEPTSFTDQ